MAQIEVVLPAMGEGIIEAEIIRWLVSEGNLAEKEQAIVEIATDKVDSEVAAPEKGIVQKILIREGEIARVGQVLAVLETSEHGLSGFSDSSVALPDMEPKDESGNEVLLMEIETATPSLSPAKPHISPADGTSVLETIRPVVLAHCSPAVRSLIKEYGLSGQDLETITGSGSRGRLTVSDIQAYIRIRYPDKQDKVPERITGITNMPDSDSGMKIEAEIIPAQEVDHSIPALPPIEKIIPDEAIYGDPGNVVEEMDRMRKLIARHMVYSSRVSPHVSSFIETDVTGLVYLRNSIKAEFENKYGVRPTITLFIVMAVVRAIKTYPRINVSADGEKIILKQRINIGIAVNLPDGNLVVPVIKDADKLSFPALAAKVHELAEKARKQELRPDDIRGGTFTITNLGNFGSLAGTPIINQPEAAILAAGAIRKKPAVISTPAGDALGIRHLMILTLTYDHRIIDGALGGLFLKQISDNLEQLKDMLI
jgi:2-oxoglutarate dehydrogenase E2 component (dihydrolipoamide succinyltransferase)